MTHAFAKWSFIAVCVLACSGDPADNSSRAGPGGGVASGTGANASNSGAGAGGERVAAGGSSGRAEVGAGGEATGMEATAGAPSSLVSPGGAGGNIGGDSGQSGGGTAGSGGGLTTAPVLPPVDSVADAGPLATVVEQNAGPDSSAWVVRPVDLGQNGLDHPIFLWGPGAGTTPSTYESYLSHWASHGFVVYSIVSTGNGTEMVAGIDWLVSENARAGSPLFENLDTNRIAAGGHSRGSLSAFGAASDPRLTTTIHVAGGSFDGLGPSNLHAPAAYICGETDTLATPNCERDYEGTTVPVFFTVMTGVDHISAARQGLPAITAWLRWHLGGEEERRAMFLDAGCAFCTAMWVSQSKNW